MIITEEKSAEEVGEILKSYKRIFIIGCGTCSTTCQTGGEDQVRNTSKKMVEKGKEVAGSIVVESPCDTRILKRDTRKFGKQIQGSDAILCLTCGVGVQNITEHLGKISIPALNTKFLGKTERIGEFYERCRACGECVLYETGGICPVVRCPKELLNGPCGGMFEGKCEVGKYERDCAWVLIYNQLKELGMLNLYRSYKPARDNSKLNVVPREIVWIKNDGVLG